MYDKLPAVVTNSICGTKWKFKHQEYAFPLVLQFRAVSIVLNCKQDTVSFPQS